MAPVRTPRFFLFSFGGWEEGQQHPLVGLCLCFRLGRGQWPCAWLGIQTRTWAAAWVRPLCTLPGVSRLMEAWEAGSDGALHNLCSLHPRHTTHSVGLLGTLAGPPRPTLWLHAPRPHVLGTKGALLSGRWSAERSWPFSSGIPQQGAQIPGTAPGRAEALRTGDSFLAALTLFPRRGGGGPSQVRCWLVRFAGPSLRLCPDVAHSCQQAGCRWD